VSTPEQESGTAPESGEERSDLGSSARTGLVWSLMNSAAARVLNVLAGLVIARVVTPAEFGTYAVALLVMTIVLSMNEIGLSVAVIRWREGVDRITPTAVTGSLVSSAFWFLLMFLAAPTIAALLNAPEATDAIRILSVGVLLDGVSTIPNALLMRAFQQRRRAVAELAGFMIGTPIGIFLAAKHGAAGLAVGLLIANAVSTALILWFAPSRPRPGWNRETAEQLIRLGLPAALTSVMLLAIVNVDSIVVSRVLGVGALGFYVLAFNIANWPWTLLSMSIRQVSLPAFSRLSDEPAELEKAFSYSLTLAGGLAVLGGVLLASLASPLVGILYGSKWLPAVVALQWLAIFGALRVILELCYDVLIATGRAGSLVRLQLGWLAVLVFVLPLGAHLAGIAGVAAAQGIVAAAFVLPLNARLLVRAGIQLGPLARALQPVLLAALAGGATALLALQISAPEGVTLIVGGLLTTIVYGAVFLATRRGRDAVRWADPPFISLGGSPPAGRTAAAQA
jgi:O-antigen/teichoic acid export membrane protein